MTIDKPTPLDQLYHPILANIYSCILYTCCVISFSMFILMLFIVIKKSPKEMTDYKYIILTQCIWNFLFDLLMSSWQPVVVFPFFLAYSKGIVKFAGLKGSYLGIQAILLVTWGLIHCLLFALFYRVVQIFYGTRFYEMFKSRKSLICTYLITGLVFIGSTQGRHSFITVKGFFLPKLENASLILIQTKIWIFYKE